MSENKKDDKVKRKDFNDFALGKDYTEKAVVTPVQQRDTYKGVKTKTQQLKRLR